MFFDNTFEDIIAKIFEEAGYRVERFFQLIRIMPMIL